MRTDDAVSLKRPSARQRVALAFLALAGIPLGAFVHAHSGGLHCKSPGAAKIHLEMLAYRLQLHRLDVGAYPDGLDELVWSQAPGWRGPYARSRSLNDPWRERIRYERIGDGFRLVSLGPDHAAGGSGPAADIVLAATWDEPAP